MVFWRQPISLLVFGATFSNSFMMLTSETFDGESVFSPIISFNCWLTPSRERFTLARSFCICFISSSKSLDTTLVLLASSFFSFVPNSDPTVDLNHSTVKVTSLSFRSLTHSHPYVLLWLVHEHTHRSMHLRMHPTHWFVRCSLRSFLNEKERSIVRAVERRFSRTNWTLLYVDLRRRCISSGCRKCSYEWADKDRRAHWTAETVAHESNTLESEYSFEKTKYSACRRRLDRIVCCNNSSFNKLLDERIHTGRTWTWR